MELYSPYLLDGATGTQLQMRGYDGRECTEKWVLEHPGELKALQEEYLRAGSRILFTPTFGANRVKLEENGIFNQVEEYNRRLAALTRETAEGRALVAGDMAPTGKFLAPLGDMSFEDLTEVYREQAAALEEAGVDLFIVETLMTVSDARAALLAIREVSRKPVIISFTCDESGQTLMGSDVTALVTIFQGMGADAFGLNCSVGPSELLKQFRRMRPYAEVPLMAKPNAGMPKIRDGKTVYECDPEEFTAHIEEMAQAGVALFGGCCGTSPDHIARIREKLEGVMPAKPLPWALDGKLPLATEKQVFPLDPAVPVPAPIPAGPDLAEQLEDEMESGLPLVSVAVSSKIDVEYLADCQGGITKPLCLTSEDAGVLEAALRVYQGRAMYDGNLPEETLRPLAEKYGLIY